MTKKTRGSSANGRRNDPNRDVQPWLGWIAALLVVVIVVVAVAMGMARTSNQQGGTPEVRMTPLVGGIEVPVATETGAAVAASEVTPIPETDSAVITDSDAITMVTVITATVATRGTMTETDTFTLTGDVTPTETIAGSTDVTTTTEISETSDVISSATVAVTQESTVAASSTDEVTPEPTAAATVAATPTPRPTATTRPTATPPVDAPVFNVGDRVTARTGRVAVHADATMDALTLDSFGPGIALEVLPPSGDFAGYPVEVDGHGWARVRAADGLVGWVMTDQVEAQ